MKKSLCVLLAMMMCLSILSVAASPNDILNSDEKSVDFVVKNGVIAVEKKENTEAILSNETIISNDGEETIVFSDTKGHWAEEYISESVKLGFFKGTGENTFAPDVYITRAQFITVLWRMSGAPDPEVKTSFLDIPEQFSEFKSAIAWGQSKGYINGVTATEFNPNGLLTREAAMKILYYYAGGQSGNEVLLAAIYDNAFTDSEEISPWAKPCMYWGVYNELIKGISKTELSPKGAITRAQLAKILSEYNYSFLK